MLIFSEGKDRGKGQSQAKRREGGRVLKVISEFGLNYDKMSDWKQRKTGGKGDEKCCLSILKRHSLHFSVQKTEKGEKNDCRIHDSRGVRIL